MRFRPTLTVGGGEDPTVHRVRRCEGARGILVRVRARARVRARHLNLNLT